MLSVLHCVNLLLLLLMSNAGDRIARPTRNNPAALGLSCGDFGSKDSRHNNPKCHGFFFCSNCDSHDDQVGLKGTDKAKVKLRNRCSCTANHESTSNPTLTKDKVGSGCSFLFQKQPSSLIKRKHDQVGSTPTPSSSNAASSTSSNNSANMLL